MTTTTKPTTNENGESVSLSDLVADLTPPAPSAAEAIDISAFAGKGRSLPALQWRRPDTVRLYKIQPTAIALMQRHPDWPVSLAMDVAVLSACHIAPVSPDKGDKTDTGARGDMEVPEFYATLSVHTELWNYLLQQAREKFPDIASSGETGASREKGKAS